MARCRFCSSKGIFLSVDEKNRCKICQKTITPENIEELKDVIYQQLGDLAEEGYEELLERFVLFAAEGKLSGYAPGARMWNIIELRTKNKSTKDFDSLKDNIPVFVAHLLSMLQDLEELQEMIE